ncbi:Mog1p/PsbP-like protein [Cylindrobasidium torrendii FP15055 ss-10]|uniref:Mog1p/PsbP-like protein n=1 Tax=Cylindrobasidium torrendii FP15055 ss-10 TaxID=1314674 RepID=A0A0D7B686_9AGAR|nr:Mog1p/PsbP-like protein [Cylindrobasidium torrendii FP15055 ss-10]
MSIHELFGGAITAIAPVNLIDASEIRQVPDTQEVLLYPDSDASIIVEVLERVQPSDYREAVKFHFDSLAHDNSATDSSVVSVDIVLNDRGDGTPAIISLSGTQKIQKFNREAVDDVQILMALYRVEQKNVDLVVTFNVPTQTETGGGLDEHGAQLVRSQFEQFTRSLKIVDFGLFA